MRLFLCAMLLCLPTSAEQPSALMTPEAQAEAHGWQPESNSFYIDGVAYRYVAGPRYAIVAAATPKIAGKYLGVKVHVYNRTRRSITVRPEDMDLVDAIGGRRLRYLRPQVVSGRKDEPPAWVKFAANTVGGSPPSPAMDGGSDPSWSDLLRALAPQVNSAADPHSQSAASEQNLQIDGADCDTGCQLRNREINSSLSRRWQSEKFAESIERTAFLSNTIPPQADVSGIVYFPMPKMAATDADDRRHSKSYAVTLTVRLAGERLHLDFPVD